MVRIERAILSVSEKTGIVEFAKGLKKYGVEILSTGGTFALLKEKGIDVKQVSDYTSFPEMMNGRVKTLHPKIHGGILALRNNDEHLASMKEHHILPIDLVVINLYPFEKTVAKKDVTFDEAVENIDIGGPSMIRSAAKNHKFAGVVVDPADYEPILSELEETKGKLKSETRLKLAKKAFGLTSAYDGAISSYLAKYTGDDTFPEVLNLNYKKVKQLRYGENPHQKGAFYASTGFISGMIAGSCLLQGKEMSYNNYLDANAAFELAEEFEETVSVIVKHSNPCGVGIGESVKDAYLKALSVDPVSAYGGVLAFNRVVDLSTAEEISKIFVEVISAPGFTDEALELFRKKQNLRLLKTGESVNPLNTPLTFRSIPGGLLIQERDLGRIVEKNGGYYSFNPFTSEEKELKVVTKRTPSQEEFKALLLAWKVVKHTKSNAIIYSSDVSTIGVGAGQMSRVDSARIAVSKAVLSLKGAVMASDAFFPFRDGLDVAAEAGITAVIQPGGSVRDNEVIEAADEHGIAMIFTGMRHFRH